LISFDRVCLVSRIDSRIGVHIFPRVTDPVPDSLYTLEGGRICLKNLIPFVGRQKELGLLDGYFEDALNYNGGFILVKGEIGSGKTRLLQHFEERTRDHNLHILRGRALKAETRPFSPFTLMVKHFLCDLEHDRRWMVKYLEPEISSYFLNLIPELRRYYPLDSPEPASSSTNLSFLYSFQRFFENLAGSRPLLIILDDIQWMSDDSLELLNYLVKRIDGLPVLLLATMRLHENNTKLEKIIDRFKADRLIHCIDLGNLSSTNTKQLLEKKFDTIFPTQFSEWLFSVTGGNPLFTGETLKGLIRGNILHTVSSGNLWVLEEDYKEFLISDTVESVVNYHLNSLSGRELNLLQKASVTGEHFQTDLLRKLADEIDNSQFLGSLNILMATGILEDSDSGMRCFSHPLVHTILYRKMEPGKRRSIHRKLAAILKQSGQQPDEVARHLTEDLQPSEETIELAHYLFDLSLGYINTGCNYRNAWKYLTIASRITERRESAGLLRLQIRAGLNHLSWIMGRNSLSISEAEAFVSELVNSKLLKEAAVVYRMLFHSALGSGNILEAEDYLKKGISVSKKDDPVHWTMAVERCLLNRRKGLLEESRREALSLIAKMPGEKVPEALYKAYTNIGFVSYVRGDQEEALHSFARAQEIVEEYHLLMYRADSHSNLGLIKMTMGKLDTAIDEINYSLREADLLQKKPRKGINLMYLGYCYYNRGDLRRASSYLEQARIVAADTENHRLMSIILRLAARIHIRSSQFDKAEAVLKRIPDQNLSKADFSDLQKVFITLHINKGEMDLAEKTVNRTLVLLKELGAETRFAHVLGQKALILLHKKQTDKARNLLEQSLKILKEKQAKPFISETLVEYGLALGGTAGEKYLIDGLKILLEINAFERITRLKEKMEDRGFQKALKFARDQMEEPADEKLEIVTFGGLSVKRPGELKAVTGKSWPSRKARELLALLLVLTENRQVTREVLALHLWPEATEKKSLANLRVVLTHLNHVLLGHFIVSDGPFLFLDKENILVDFWEFNSLSKQWRDSLRQGKLHIAEDRARRALSLYRSYLLPEFYSLPIVDMQLSLENVMRDLLLWLANRCMMRAEWREAILLARKLAASDSCSEQAFRIIMQGLFNLGNRTGAIRQYKQLLVNLRENLGVSPEKETVDLFMQISSQTQL